MSAQEITTPVTLCRPDGRLDPDAVGWTRRPLHDTSGIGRGRYGWGRTKRWEYWAVMTPTHVVSLTISDIDYAGVHELWVLDRATGAEVRTPTVVPFARGVRLPARLGDGTGPGPRARPRPGDRRGAGRHPAARPLGPDRAGRASPHDPTGTSAWASSCRGPSGSSSTPSRTSPGPRRAGSSSTACAHELPAGSSWAVLDHGRGRWPYRMRWHWGAGSGVHDGRVIGVQVGGRWTDGTGSTENALLVDGRLHKNGDELVWEHDPTDPLAPWRIHGPHADLRSRPPTTTRPARTCCSSPRRRTSASARTPAG